MYKVQHPNDIPWEPNMAVLGTIDAVVVSPDTYYKNAQEKQAKIRAIKLLLAAKVTTKAIHKMIASSMPDELPKKRED